MLGEEEGGSYESKGAGAMSQDLQVSFAKLRGCMSGAVAGSQLRGGPEKSRGV